MYLSEELNVTVDAGLAVGSKSRQMARGVAELEREVLLCALSRSESKRQRLLCCVGSSFGCVGDALPVHQLASGRSMGITNTTGVSGRATLAGSMLLDTFSTALLTDLLAFLTDASTPFFTSGEISISVSDVLCLT